MEEGLPGIRNVLSSRLQIAMKQHSEQPSDDDQVKKLQEQWEKEWGPEIPRWRRHLSAIVIVGGFVAVIVVVMITAS